VPYLGNAQDMARAYYQRMTQGRDPEELVRTMWTNPIDTLLAYLADPEPKHWQRRAEAVVAGAMQVASARSTCDGDGVAEQVSAALRGEPLPAPTAGRIAVGASVDASGCPLTIVLDQRDGVAWSAFTVIDDRTETIRADEAAHQRRWAAWLYWGNLLQFLDFGAGDSAQLAFTALDDFDPAQLAASGGGGLLTALSLLPLDEDLIDETKPLRREPATDTDLDATQPVRPVAKPAKPHPAEDASGVGGEPAVEQRWREVFDLLDPDDPALALLAQRLAEHGVPAPEEIGYELGEQAWQAEMAWPSAKVAVVLAGDGEEERKRDAAYAAAGWEVRPAGGWTVEELAERIGGTK